MTDGATVGFDHTRLSRIDLEPDAPGSAGLDPREVEHVASLELALLDPRVRRAPDLISGLLHPDVSEVGASGRRWDHRSLLAALEAGGSLGEGSATAEDPPEASDVRAVPLSPDVVLVTYVALPRPHVPARLGVGPRCRRRLAPALPPGHRGRRAARLALPTGAPRTARQTVAARPASRRATGTRNGEQET